jgi:DNA polymerase
LGSIASKTLFETTSGVTRTRGVFREIEVLNLKVQAIATFHPAYLLRSPSEKSVVNGDLLLVKRRLEEFP